MDAKSTVPQLVDKKGGNYAAIAPKIELEKFNKWKKHMLCYLAGMEPYYLKCIKDCPFQPKIAEDDIMESVISCETAKATWSDLVHSFKGVLDTKENRIIDLKLEYQTFRTKPTESLSQTYTRCLVAETFDWDEEEVSDDEEVTKVKVLMALADDELSIGKNHARNGEWIDIIIRKVNILLSMDEDSDWQNYLKYINIDLMFIEEQRLNLLSKYNKIIFELNKCRDELLILKQAKLDAVTFQIQNTELTKLNHALHEQLKEEKKINEKWLTDSKKQASKLNTGRILVPESQAVNESLKPTEASTDPESSKDSEAESLTPLPPLKILHGASPSSKEEHPRCCQAKGSKVEENLVHLMMVVKFKVLIKKKKMCSLGLMRFDWLMEFLMVHLEELEIKKLLWEKDGLKKMKMIRRVGRMAYLIRKHGIEVAKHED
ncbi:hypothetical protein Tco_0458277 [Tanacetum coccineum]